jgi:hypothetical protein
MGLKTAGPASVHPVERTGKIAMFRCASRAGPLALQQGFGKQFRHVLRAGVCQVDNLVPATCT